MQFRTVINPLISEMIRDFVVVCTCILISSKSDAGEIIDQSLLDSS